MANRIPAASARPVRARELRTIAAMIDDYCAGAHHAPDGTCAACSNLLAYAARRLEHCPYGDDKPTCVKCPIHCYQAERREAMKAVMRYAGPRLMTRHPWLALRHWLDGRKPAPQRPGRPTASARRAG